MMLQKDNHSSLVAKGIDVRDVTKDTLNSLAKGIDVRDVAKRNS